MLVGVLWLVGIFGLDRLVREQHRETFPVVTEPNHILLHLDAWCPFHPFVQQVLFTNDPENDSVTTNSTLIWFNAAGATPNLYPDGFTNQALAVASPYATNAPYANDLLGASTSSGDGYVFLSGGDLGANPVVKKVGITNNIISLVSSKDKSLSLYLVPNTGVVAGWYIDPQGYSNNIEGAIFQNNGLSTGYFTGVTTNQTGLFMLLGN